ncbi:hypothetical protein [Olsenella sp. CU969]|uniref:hypothetical protein n=1 Tax=Olsenella sp. CU969 TaxID=2780101 RepID=UPI00195EDB90|nr:hypothetical protein [Olsenella sp. CU969]MBF0598946.1 hypothetical protein [Atopobiaceae bacterium FL090493]
MEDWERKVDRFTAMAQRYHANLRRAVEKWHAAESGALDLVEVDCALFGAVGALVAVCDVRPDLKDDKENPAVLALKFANNRLKHDGSISRMGAPKAGAVRFGFPLVSFVPDVYWRDYPFFKKEWRHENQWEAYRAELARRSAPWSLFAIASDIGVGLEIEA